LNLVLESTYNFSSFLKIKNRDLSENQLSGAIPDEIGHMSELKIL